MSPEQARGEELDARSDIFSFGAVLYEMATGKQAFSGNTTAVMFDAILNREPMPARRLNPELPPKLDEIIRKALEKDRKLRYQSAADLLADLQRIKRDSDSQRRCRGSRTGYAVRRKAASAWLWGAAACRRLCCCWPRRVGITARADRQSEDATAMPSTPSPSCPS